MTKFLRSQRVQYALIAISTVFIVLQVLHTWKDPADPRFRSANVARDFKTFYCAGATANAGGNPYLAESFDRCGTPNDGVVPSFARSNLWPAPIPGYDVALFRVIAHLPYRLAAFSWLAVCLAALTFAIVEFSRLARVPPIVVFAVFALPLYYSCLEWGQLPPVVVGLLAVAVYALRTNRSIVAGVAVALTLLEPHLGVPICLAVFLWVPGSRVSLACTIAGLVLISIATQGISLNVSYFTIVLPLQAAAEIPAVNQYSLTWLAFILGAPDRFATALGSLDYAVMTGLGVWFARVVARKLERPEAIVLVPSGIVVLGGPYVHESQTCVSLLLGLFLIGTLERVDLRRLACIGVSLQVPVWFVEIWRTHPYSLIRFESAAAVAIVAASLTCASSAIPRKWTVGLAAGAAYLVLSFALLHAPHRALRAPVEAARYEQRLGSNAAYSAGRWGVVIRADAVNRSADVVDLATKLPLWFGLVALFVTVWRVARMPAQRRVVSTASAPPLS